MSDEEIVGAKILSGLVTAVAERLHLETQYVPEAIAKNEGMLDESAEEVTRLFNKIMTKHKDLMDINRAALYDLLESYTKLVKSIP